jgi:ADP-ribose pyrophosphatase
VHSWNIEARFLELCSQRIEQSSINEERALEVDRPRRVQVESKRRIFDDFFKIEEAFLKYERFEGRMSRTIRRLNFERRDSVAAIIFNREARRVILVNQFRYPTLEKGPAWVTEVLAGVLEPNEDPEAAIRREILEEIGYRVGDLMHIATFYMSPGGSSERIILYSAEVDNADKATSGGGLASEDEDIKILEFSLADLWAAFQSGEIVDAKTIIALMWLRDHVEEGR